MMVSLYDIPLLTANLLHNYNFTIYNAKMEDFLQDDICYESLFKHFKTVLKSKIIWSIATNLAVTKVVGK